MHSIISKKSKVSAAMQIRARLCFITFKNGTKTKHKPKSEAEDATKNHRPPVYRQHTPMSKMRVTENVPRVQANLFSGTIRWTTVKDAAVRRDAKTIKNQVRDAPVAKLTIRHTKMGIIKIAEMMPPTIADFLLKNLL